MRNKIMKLILSSIAAGICLTVLLLFNISQESSGKIKIIEMNNGVVDYIKSPPFTNNNGTSVEKLAKILKRITPSKESCKIGSVLVWEGQKYSDGTTGSELRVDLLANVCDDNQIEELKKVIQTMAPTLVSERMTFWVTDIDGNEALELLVGYMDISDNQDNYPYFSIWRLSYNEGKYDAQYAGPFLNGSFHAVEQFGESSSKKVFIKKYSCMECHPLVFLTPIDFDIRDTTRYYEFSYDRDHTNFQPNIEYFLPGAGHTVEASVETRILHPSDTGPHLLQFFDMEELPDEYWTFTCEDLRCDFKIDFNEPSEYFIKFWNIAKKL